MFLMKLLALSRGEGLFSVAGVGGVGGVGGGAVVDGPVDEAAFLVEGGVLYILFCIVTPKKNSNCFETKKFQKYITCEENR
jgi:hypothetical protein